MELHVLEKSSQNEFVQCHSSPLLFSKLDAHTHTHTVFKCVLLVNTNAFGEVKPNIFICSIATHRIIRNKIFFCECFFHCLFFFSFWRIKSKVTTSHVTNGTLEVKFFPYKKRKNFFFEMGNSSRSISMICVFYTVSFAVVNMLFFFLFVYSIVQQLKYTTELNLLMCENVHFFFDQKWQHHLNAVTEEKRQQRQQQK